MRSPDARRTPAGVSWFQSLGPAARARCCSLIATLLLLAAAVHPPRGFGVRLCYIHLSTGLDCPGCGLTRSLSCGVRGLWAESFRCHAFGPVVVVLLAAAALGGVLPARQLTRLHLALKRHAQRVRLLRWGAVAALLVYGIGRAAWRW